ncbi:hypothetical protein [Phytohabitans houttuyneae]|uniref:Uncharacterized protein n=1 Tax=Phytohabitans houttuyneae TaxID=1076126 RepID=A0A6V8JX36_9ACTN|nr:hypothetical protein [Phytohabitans houttuyneae]GFJ77252.1 hypothetical protein Phou_014320 [Phytohabitans houttuyneae]
MIVTDVRAEGLNERDLFIGGAGLGLAGAFVVEAVGVTIGLAERFLRSRARPVQQRHPVVRRRITRRRVSPPPPTGRETSEPATGPTRDPHRD